MSRSRSRSPVSDDGTYRIRAQAFLLTWAGRVELDQFRSLDIFSSIAEYSITIERASIVHSHAFIVLKKKSPHLLLSVFNVEGRVPNCSPCKAKGNSARRSRDRGHFYVFCEFKDGNIWSTGNYRPCRDYAVDLNWIRELWQQGKISHPLEAAANYRCLTSAFESMVKRCAAYSGKVLREKVLTARAIMLKGSLKPFRVYPEIESWQEQFEIEKPRYNFLWLWGPSQTGKTALARSLLQRPFVHASGVNWASYDPTEHDGIIFDDVADVNSYVKRFKTLFQAGGVTTCNTSATNCYALAVDTAGKRIIVCDNHAPTEGWICLNAVLLKIDSPTWIEQHAICDSLFNRWAADSRDHQL
jgi:hypothetical protein